MIEQVIRLTVEYKESSGGGQVLLVKCLFIQAAILERRLRDEGFTHLSVAIEKRNFVIYSQERIGVPNRAILLLSGDQFTLGLADPKGKWQLTPFVGSPDELLDILMHKLVFPFVRWR